MATSKKNGKEPAAKATGNAPRDQHLILWCGGALALIALLVLCFGYLLMLERPSHNSAQLDAIANRFAQSQAALLNGDLAGLRLRLLTFAEDPALATALEANDAQAVTAFEQQLKRALPESVDAKVVVLGPLGIASLKTESLALRNNIELDLLRRASGGEIVEPEAYQYQEQWYYSLALAVKQDDKKYASGALFVTFDTSHLQKLLSQLDGAQGETALIQTLGKQQAVIALGEAGDAQLARLAPTEVDAWQIRFTPSAALQSASSLPTLTVWLMLALTTLLVLAASVISSGLYKKALTGNLQKLSAIDGKNLGSYSLPGFAETAKALQQRLAAAASMQSAKKEASDAAQDSFKPTPTKNGDAETRGGGPGLPNSMPATIFRAYDIRGLAEQELTDSVVYAIGLAIGSEALDQGQQTVVVGADGRHSSPRIRAAMVQGLLASGRDVIDIGTVPTPLVYFATHQLGTQSGVMITGSHNPAEYNGVKIVIGGHTLSGNAIASLRQRIEKRDFAAGQGSLRQQTIDRDYIDYIVNDVAIAQPLKIVIDAGNGVAGSIAPALFEELGCEVTGLYCNVDGNFPNHHPDPAVASNLTDLINTVQAQGADLGIAFDGDGDRLGVVTAGGHIVPADRLLMLLAQDVVSRNPGADVIFDVKCTRNLNTLISNFGGRPIMWKSGHSFMKEKMAETGALLGGEYSGHIFFNERWFGFDDGIYAAARLIEILSTTDPDLDGQLAGLPDSVSTPEIKVAADDQQKFDVIGALTAQASFPDGKLSTLDGVRVDFPDGWGLVRASNTTPALILRFEADNAAALERIKSQFKTQLSAVDSSLRLGF